MEKPILALIFMGVAAVIGGLYVAFSKGVFTGLSAGTQKQIASVTAGQYISFNVISPNGDYIPATNGTTADNITVYYAKVPFEIQGDQAQLHDQTLIVKSQTAGWYVSKGQPDLTKNWSDLEGSYYKVVIDKDVNQNAGDLTLDDVYVFTKNTPSTSGTKVTLSIQVGETERTAVVYVYASS